MPRSNIIPFGQPVDYELRSKFVSPLSPEELARIMGERVDLYDSFRAMPSARAGQPPARAVFHRLGYAVPITIAVGAALYFAGQLLRAVL